MASSEPMTLIALARLARDVRRMQAEYFRTRQPETLNQCRDYERRLDRAIEAILAPPEPDLFEQQQ